MVYCPLQFFWKAVDCLLFLIIKMTIRHRGNISHQLAEIDMRLANHKTPPQPTTPQFITAPQQIDNFNIMRDTRTSFSHNMLGIKEQSIKTIDDKINQILQKHQKKDTPNENRTPLQAKNIYPQYRPEQSQFDLSPKPKQFRFDSDIENSAYHPSIEDTKQEIPKRRMTITDCVGTQSTHYPHSTYGTQSTHSPSFRRKVEGRSGLKQDKQFDDQILKLNQRIRMAEEQKKKLNINFSPFSSKSPQPKQKNTINEALTKLTPNKYSPKAKQKGYTPTAQAKRNSVTPQIKEGSFKKQGFAGLEGYRADYGKDVRSQQGKGCIRHQSGNRRDVDWGYEFGVNKTSKQFVGETGGGSRSKKQVTGQLACALMEQIKLDEELRNMKIWFTFSNNPKKWQCLQQEVRARGIDVQNLKGTFESGIEEHNPFFRWQGIGFEEGIKGLVSAYEQCEGYWRMSVMKRWSRRGLESEAIRENLLYDGNSEVITIEDLVRFVNMEKATVYRNRDLYLIYSRLWSPTTKRVEYGSFIQAVSAPYI